MKAAVLRPGVDRAHSMRSWASMRLSLLQAHRVLLAVVLVLGAPRLVGQPDFPGSAESRVDSRTFARGGSGRRPAGTLDEFGGDLVANRLAQVAPTVAVGEELARAGQPVPAISDESAKAALMPTGGDLAAALDAQVGTDAKVQDTDPAEANSVDDGIRMLQGLRHGLTEAIDFARGAGQRVSLQSKQSLGSCY